MRPKEYSLDKITFKHELRGFARNFLLDPLDHWDLEAHWQRYLVAPEEYRYVFPNLRKENLDYARKFQALHPEISIPYQEEEEDYD